jgi:FAD/FMN-containing dehydrogenase
VLLLASAAALARKIFSYAAAPDREKESDYIFPASTDQQKPSVLVAEPEPPPFSFEQRGGFVNDASHLNRTAVYGVVQIRTEDDIRNALQYARVHGLKVTCAGQRHSMGGQTFTHGGLVLDLRLFNRIQLDKEHKTVNLQSGVRWWELQQLLDPVGCRSSRCSPSTFSAWAER